MKSTIVKFDGTNFKVWKFQLEMYFKAKGWEKTLAWLAQAATQQEKEDIAKLNVKAWPSLALTLDPLR